MCVGAGEAATARPAEFPNSQRHSLTSTPTWAVCTAAGAAAGTGIGITGAAAADNKLGTNGTSPGGFLSRLPMFESSTLG